MRNISMAWLTINYTCDCMCSWCYAKEKVKEKQYMDFELAKNIIDYLNRRLIKNITLIGGEPTIYPFFIELIQYLSEKQINVRVATNGKKFSDEEFTKKAIKAGMDHVNISIKGTSEKEYLCNTNQYGFEQMLNGYYNIDKYKIDLSISYVVIDNNKETFDKFINMIETKKLDNIIIQFEKPSIGLNSYMTTMDIKEMGDFVSYIYGKLEEKNLNYTIEVSFPLCLIEKNILNELIREKRISTICHVRKENGIVFDIYGRVVPCNHFLGYPFEEKSLNLKDEMAIECIFKTEIAEKMKKIMNRYPSERCIKCDLWEICGGGCFTRWFYIKPEEYIR